MAAGVDATAAAGPDRASRSTRADARSRTGSCRRSVQACAAPPSRASLFAYDLSINPFGDPGPHGRDRRDVIVGANQHHGIGRTTDALAEAVAHIEQRALAQAGIERRVPPRHDDMPEPGRRALGNFWTPPHVSEVQRDETVVGQIVHADGTAVR